MIIGIDIGTSYSSVAVLENGRAESVKPKLDSDKSIPSAVYVTDRGEVLIGNAAMHLRMKEPSRFRNNFKRDFGTTKPYLLGGLEVFPDDIYTKYFEYFVESVKDYTNEPITKAYITHPANYTNEKKLLLKKAAQNGGIWDIELVDEPSAAAYSYFTNSTLKAGEKLLVYDLGGGTFDITLAEMTNNGLRILTEPLGLNCGGTDFDRFIYDDIITSLSSKADLTEALTKQLFKEILIENTIKLKHTLSGQTLIETAIPFGFESLGYIITREHFNSLISGRVNETCRLVERIAQNAGINVADIDKVLCVGGSTRIPLVEERLAATIGKKPLKTGEPELAVCLGAVMMDAEYERRRIEKEEAERRRYAEELRIQEENRKRELEEAERIRKAQEEERIRKAKEEENRKLIEREEAERRRLEDEEKRKQVEQEKAIINLNRGCEFARTGNYDEAVKLHRKAAEQGLMAAQYNLGFYYEKGQGVPQNYSEALKWYRKAAEQGHVKAQNNLGILYSSGQGIPQDYAEASKWCRRAAEQGHADSQCALGVHYIFGSGVPKDHIEAAKWFRKAAEQGHEHAHFFLGDCYENGKGVSIDYNEALKWYQKAAEQGHKKAQSRFDALQKEFNKKLLPVDYMGKKIGANLMRGNKAVYFNTLSTKNDHAPGFLNFEKDKIVWDLIHLLKKEQITILYDQIFSIEKCSIDLGLFGIQTQGGMKIKAKSNQTYQFDLGKEKIRDDVISFIKYMANI